MCGVWISLLFSTPPHFNAFAAQRYSSFSLLLISQVSIFSLDLGQNSRFRIYPPALRRLFCIWSMQATSTLLQSLQEHHFHRHICWACFNPPLPHRKVLLTGHFESPHFLIREVESYKNRLCFCSKGIKLPESSGGTIVHFHPRLH